MDQRWLDPQKNKEDLHGFTTNEKCTVSKFGNLNTPGIKWHEIYIIILSALSLLFHLHPPNLVPMSTMSLVFVVICLWMQKVTSSCASTWFPGVLCDSVLEAQAITVILLMEKEIRRSPVEVGSLSHFLQGLYIPGGCLGFLNHQQ